MPDEVSALHRLVREIRDYAAAAASLHPALLADLDHIRCETERLVLRHPLVPSASDAPHRHLGAALDAGEAGPLGPLAAALRPVGHLLPWRYSYAERGAELADHIAFAELAGPRGPFDSATLRLGFTLVGPGILYPAHAHPAIELYAVIAGTARWTMDGASTLQPPGALILHPSGAAHAMETTSETLLALYSWRGDVESPPLYV